MPEQEKSTLIERFVQGILSQASDGVRQSIERFARRMVRKVAIALAGVVIAVLGIAFTAMGIVKWLSYSQLMPSWLAWLVVGIILLLVGVVLTRN